MGTVHAVFENGVFRPLEEIELPNGAKVEFEPRVIQAPQPGQRERIAAILSKSYDTDEPELAAKHNEHQPLAILNQDKGMTKTKLDLTSGDCC